MALRPQKWRVGNKRFKYGVSGVPPTRSSGVLVVVSGGTGGGSSPGAPAFAKPIGPAAGDLYGMYPAPNVGRLRGKAISTTPPTDGQKLVFDEDLQQWVPTTEVIPEPSAAVPLQVLAGDTFEVDDNEQQHAPVRTGWQATGILSIKAGGYLVVGNP